MKIIEHGKYYEQENNIAKCNCGCKFRYDEDEVTAQTQTEEVSYKDYRKYLYKWVKCPECGNGFVAHKKEIERYWG